MPHSLQPHNTFFSLSMVVSNTKATTERKSGCLQAEEGKTPFYTAQGRQGWDTTQLQISLKLPQQAWNCNTYSNLKQYYWKTTEYGVCIFPSLGFVYFAGLCTLHIHLSDSFSWRIRAKEEAHWRHLGLLWEFSHVSILAIKYESWGNFSSRHSCHQDYFHVPRRLWIKCYTRRQSRRDIPGNSGLIHQLLFNHQDVEFFPHKITIITNRQDYFSYPVFQKCLQYTRGVIWHEWKLNGTKTCRGAFLSQSHSGNTKHPPHTELRAKSTASKNNVVIPGLRMKRREKNTHLSARTYGWDVCQVRGRNFITEIKRPKLWISCFWYSPWTIPDK